MEYAVFVSCESISRECRGGRAEEEQWNRPWDRPRGRHVCVWDFVCLCLIPCWCNTYTSLWIPCRSF